MLLNEGVMMTRKCKDCYHSRPGKISEFLFWRWSFAKCHHESSIVEGTKNPRYHLGEDAPSDRDYSYCSEARSDGGPCGPQAKLFEPRPK